MEGTLEGSYFFKECRYKCTKTCRLKQDETAVLPEAAAALKIISKAKIVPKVSMSGSSVVPERTDLYQPAPEDRTGYSTVPVCVRVCV